MRLLNNVSNLKLIFRFNLGHLGFLTPAYVVELAILENMVGVFRILILSCLQAEIHAFPVQQRPYWMFDSRLRRTKFPLVPLSWPSLKHGTCLWNFDSTMCKSWDTCTSGITVAILNFWLPFTAYSIGTSSSELLHLENVGVAVTISLLA